MDCEMKPILTIALLLLLPFAAYSQKGKKDTSYAKIFKLVYVDGITSYGSEEFKDGAAEKKFIDEKEEALEKEYNISMEEYKTAMEEYKKSKEKDKTAPMKIVKPSYRLESRKYVSEKDREKMEKSLEKKIASAEKLNEKLKK